MFWFYLASVNIIRNNLGIIFEKRIGCIMLINKIKLFVVL